jgi:hypothetical protein
MFTGLSSITGPKEFIVKGKEIHDLRYGLSSVVEGIPCKGQERGPSLSSLLHSKVYTI